MSNFAVDFLRKTQKNIDTDKIRYYNLIKFFKSNTFLFKNISSNSKSNLFS